MTKKSPPFFLLLLFMAVYGNLYGQKPTITTFSPASGPVGTSVTITGTNFNATAANDIVFFGTVKAAVSAASATSLTVTVPLGAVYGPINVLNSTLALQVASAKSFITTFTPNKGAITTVDVSPKVDFTSATNPINIGIGDIDGDGKSDLVVANFGSNTVSVYRNTSASGSITTASFAAKVDFTTGTSPTGVTIGDLDGDGKLDLAVVNYGSGTVSVFRNTATSGSITTGSFAAKVDFTTGTSPTDVEIGDLDGDGKPDLVVANFGAASLSVLRNISVSGVINIGSFSTKVDFTVGTNPGSAAIVDLDGDGKPDLAVVNTASNTVSVLRNTATSGAITTGSFSAKVDFTTGTTPYNLAVGDLDGDGRPELVAANQGGGTISIFRNTATSGSITTASFATKADLTTGLNPYSVAIGDLDGDGKPDLVTANEGSGTVSVFRNVATSGSITTSSFTTKVDFTCGTNPYSVVIGDMDGDGKPDFATANYGSNTVSVFRDSPIYAPTITSFASTAGTQSGNNITNQPVAGGSTITIAGTNFLSGMTISSGASGAVTVVSATQATFTLAAGSSLATLTPVVTTTGGTSVGSATITYVAAPPTITSFSPASGPAGTTVTITGTNFNATAASNIVFFGATQATVSAASATSLTVAVPAGATYQFITVLNTASVYQASSAKPFITTFTPNKGTIATSDISPKVDFTAGTTPAGVAIGDLDGDGKPDLVVADYGSNTISLYRNTSATGSIVAGSFAAKVDLVTGTSPYSVAIGDLDGDGKLDLAVTNLGDNTVSIFRNTASSGSISTSSFAAKVDIATGTNPYSVAIGDLDGDGKPDLAVANFGDNTLSVLRNISTSGSITTGSFAARVNLATGTNPRSVAIADLDGDGKPDLAVANRGSNTVSVLRNISASGSITAGSFSVKVDFATGSSPAGLAIGDLDGDGKLDLAVANLSSNTVSVLRNTSTSGSIAANSFVAKVDFTTGSSPSSVALGDLDGDGKPDFVVANRGANTVSVLRNTSASGSITTGSFSAKVDFVTGATPYSAVIGDLDADGKSDLVVAGSGYNALSVFRNSPMLLPTITSFASTAGMQSGNNIENQPAAGGSTITMTGTNFLSGMTISAGVKGAVTIVSSTQATFVLATGSAGQTVSPLLTTTNGTSVASATISYTGAALSALTVSAGTLSPAFAPTTLSYSVTVLNVMSSISLTPTVTNDNATIKVNGTTVSNRSASAAIALNTGSNTITTVVTAQDATTQTYTLTVTRATPASALDKVTSNIVANAAYSLRQLKSTYTHAAITAPATVSGVTNSTTPVIRARRSGDNALLDIGYTTNGDLDTATLKTFVGTGGGFVAIWYDQSGNSFDVAQTNNALQPIVVTNGTVERSGILPAVRFDNPTQTVLNANVAAGIMFGSGYAGSAFPVYEATAANVNSSAFGYGNGSDRWQVHPVAGAYFDAGSPSTRVQVEDASYASGIKNYSFIAGAAGQYIYANGTLATSSSTAPSPCTQTQFNIGGIPNFNYYHQGHESELLVYGSAVATADRQSVEANQSAYYSTKSVPVIASFSPQSGSAGTSVTITGTNFTGATSVYFGGVAAASFKVVSATAITATVGLGNSGIVTVVTPKGTANISGGMFTTALDKAGITDANASAAYSLRQLKTTYTHSAIAAMTTVSGYTNSTTPLIRARRSGDNALLDIGYTANGDLDTATLKSFVGIGGGYIAIWYDQSGNNFDVAQTNYSSQPIIVTNGTVERSGVMPAARFVNAAQTYLAAYVPAASMFGSGYMGTVLPVFEASAANVPSSVFGYGNNNDRWQVHGVAGAYFDAGNPSNRVYVSDNSLAGVINTYGFVAGTNLQQLYVNGVLKASSTSAITACTQTQFNIGGMPNFKYYHQGHESEIIVYGSVLSSADQKAAQANQATYYMPSAKSGSTGMAVTTQQPQAMSNSVNMAFTSTGGSGTTTYALEKQTSTGSFASVASLTGPGAANYALADPDPANGENYYKVHATDSKGNQAYSEIMRVNITNGRGTSIAPNPVLNKQVVVHFNKMPQGQYLFTIVSMSGYMVDKRTLSYDGDSPSVTIAAPTSAHTGVYIITIASGDYKRAEKVVIE